jgi:4,5-DOPA dioxygenase extradiol
MATDPSIRALAAAPDNGATMPALFIGHGSPMNAIEDSEFSRAWAEVAHSLPKPQAVLCVSAHWQTAGTRVTAIEQPTTIHDFYGFPPALFDKRYPAPGSSDLARATQEMLCKSHVELDSERGLDHGAWAVLCRMFPDADVPVVQLSLDQRKSPAFHYELGRELRGLRKKGVLIIGSGNIVHNLHEMAWEGTAYDWALEFDAQMKELILSGDHKAIIDYSKLGRSARLAVPTLEHYLPLLYVLGAQDKTDRVKFFADKVTLGSMSMRSVRLG